MLLIHACVGQSPARIMKQSRHAGKTGGRSERQRREPFLRLSPGSDATQRSRKSRSGDRSSRNVWPDAPMTGSLRKPNLELQTGSLRLTLQAEYGNGNSSTKDTDCQIKERQATAFEITLVGVVHIGESQYYQEIQENFLDNEQSAQYCLCECITGDNNLMHVNLTTSSQDDQNNRTSLHTGIRLLKVPVQSSAEQRRFAVLHALRPQMDVLNLFPRRTSEEKPPRVFVADASKEEIGAKLRETLQATGIDETLLSVETPLATCREIMTMVLRGRSRDKTFLSFLRVLSFLSPCPELNLLILDWSTQHRLPSDGVEESTSFSGINYEALLEFASAFSRFDLIAMRQIVFANILLNNSNKKFMLSTTPPTLNTIEDDKSSQDIVIGYRNDKVLKAIRTLCHIHRDNLKSIAVVYGVSHMDDLVNRLLENGESRDSVETTSDSDDVDDINLRIVDMGNMKYSTVMTINQDPLTELNWARLGLFTVPSYLLLGFYDYIDTIQSLVIIDSALATDQTMPFMTSRILKISFCLFLYIVRRSLFYWAFTRWLIRSEGTSAVY